jgi:hypothetical protein
VSCRGCGRSGPCACRGPTGPTGPGGGAGGPTGPAGPTGAGSTGPTGPAGGGTGAGPLTNASDIIFRPGGVTGGGVFATWAEIKAYVSAATVPLNVWVDTSISAAIVDAPTAVTPMGLVTLRSLQPGNVLQIDDGATLSDMTRVHDLTLDFRADVTPGLSYGGTTAHVEFFNSSFVRGNVSANPVYSVPAGFSLLFVFVNDGGSAMQFADNTLSGSPLIHVDATGNFGLSVQGGPANVADETVTAAATGSVTLTTDTNLSTYPTFSGVGASDYTISALNTPLAMSSISVETDVTLSPGQVAIIDSVTLDITVTLPSTAAVTDGTQCIVKCEPLTIHNVTVRPFPGEGQHIDSAATFVMTPSTVRKSTIFVYVAAAEGGAGGWIVAAAF